MGTFPGRGRHRVGEQDRARALEAESRVEAAEIGIGRAPMAEPVIRSGRTPREGQHGGPHEPGGGEPGHRVQVEAPDAGVRHDPLFALVRPARGVKVGHDREEALHPVRPDNLDLCLAPAGAVLRHPDLAALAGRDGAEVGIERRERRAGGLVADLLRAVLRPRQGEGGGAWREILELPAVPASRLDEHVDEPPCRLALRRVEEHVEMVGDADPDRQEPPSERTVLEIGRGERDEPSVPPQGGRVEAPRREGAPPGDRPGRGGERRRGRRATPEVPPIRFEPRQILGGRDEFGRPAVRHAARTASAAPADRAASRP